MPSRERQRPGAGSMLRPQPEPLMPTATVPTPETSRRDDEEGVEPLVYLSARVPKSLRTELQLYAVREGMPVAKLVQDAVRAFLDAHTGT